MSAQDTGEADTGGAERFRAAGLELAHSLSRDAVWAGDRCAFHGATAPESLAHPPRARSMGADLYEGSAGIARFLGLAAACSGEDQLRRTALGALRHALSGSEGWSLFSGGLGAGLVALELAGRLGEPSLMDPALALIDHASAAADAALATTDPAGAADRPGGSQGYDLLSGAAGVVVGLAAAIGHDPGAWRDRAVRLGRALLAAAVQDGPELPDGRPLSWPLEAGSPIRLCGLAHGASGVALAFEALAGIEPDGAPQWRAVARRARAFERGHYSPEAGSWADLRPVDTDGPRSVGYPHMWCHGSVGISAERLGALAHDELARADALGGLAGIRTYAERLLAGPAGPGAGDSLNASVCHGLAGVLDLCVDTWLVSRDPTWARTARGLADLMLNDARRPEGWRSGVPGGWPAPGLMLGRAGTGWSLLRLADPDAVPSVWRPVTAPP